MSFAGARSAGDRRRRRMAVGHDHGTERSPENGESIPLADLLQKTMAGRSLKLIPGLPVRLWVVWLTISLATLSVAFASWLLIAHTSLPVFFAPITQRLFSSSDAVFSIVLESAGWLAAGQIFFLIGWCRSRSSLDFKGRYRVWYWAGVLSLTVSLCRLLDLHSAIAEMILQTTQWKFWNPVNVLWTSAAFFTGTLLVRNLDRDMRSSRLSLWSLRVTAALMMICVCMRLALDRSASLNGQVNANAELSLAILRLWTAGAVLVTAWLHLRQVVYFSADPPASQERRANRITRVLSGMKLFRWWGVKRPSAPAKPTRVRKKAAASEDAPKKTTRKKATKKRTTRARTVVQSEVADDSELSEATYDEESYESSDQPTDESGEEPLDRDAEIQRAMDEEDWDRLEELTRPDHANASNSSSSGKDRSTRHHQSASSSRKQVEEESDVSDEATDSADSGEESADQDYMRVDEGHKSLKGLSKKQRRDMKKRQKHGGYDDSDDE